MRWPPRPVPAALAVAAALWLSAALGQGARQSMPADLAPAALQPGEFIWTAEAVPAGPVLVVISLDEQRAYVYRNGLRIGVSTASTGKAGYETPTGVFTILQKKVEHRSNLYSNAPMPFMQRLTWDGVALHAGHLPGYPASHGCIRLPYEFARRLYEVTGHGMTVVVAGSPQASPALAHPGLFAPAVAPARPAGAADVPVPAAPLAGALAPWEAYRWQPELAPGGPLTVLVSTADRLALVIRNGVEIGRAEVEVTPGPALGTRAFVLLDGDAGTPSALVPDRPARRWQGITLPGYDARPAPPPAAAVAPAPAPADLARRLRLPEAFARLVYDLLVPGSTVLLTDAPVLPESTGPAMTVIATDPEALPTEPPAPVEP